MGTVFRNNPSEQQELLESQKVYHRNYLRKMHIKLQLAFLAVFCIFAVALADPSPAMFHRGLEGLYNFVHKIGKRSAVAPVSQGGYKGNNENVIDYLKRHPYDWR